MKKTYITPLTEEVKINVENVILAGSDPTTTIAGEYDPEDPNEDQLILGAPRRRW